MKAGHQSDDHGHEQDKDHNKGIPGIPFDDGRIIERPEQVPVKNQINDNLNYFHLVTSLYVTAKPDFINEGCRAQGYCQEQDPITNH
jgi:hypothetical protein